MTGYVGSAMHDYQHKLTTRPHHAPHKWERPDYEAKTQWEPNESKKLSSRLRK